MCVYYIFTHTLLNIACLQSIGEKFDIIEIEHRYHDVRFQSDDIHIHKFTRKS